MRQHLESNGARVLRASELNNASVEDLKRGYFIIPHDVEVDLTALPERAGLHITLVTNWWVERCLYGKHLVDPADDVLSRPFERRTISGRFTPHISFLVTDVVRFLWTNHQFDRLFRHRVTACDKSGHIDGYGDSSASTEMV